MRRTLWKRLYPGRTSRDPGGRANYALAADSESGIEECACGARFQNEQWLKRHEKKCPVVLEQAASAYEEAEGNEARRKRQRLGVEANEENGPQLFQAPLAGSDIAEPMELDQDPPPGAAAASGSHSGSRRRRTKLSQKVRDMLPGRNRSDNGQSGAGFTTALLNALDSRTEGADPQTPPAPEPTVDLSAGGHAPGATVQEPEPRRVRFTTFRSQRNKFGLFKVFQHRPTTTLPGEPTLEERYEPHAASNAKKASSRTLRDIIRPFPNFSAWLWSHWFWSKSSSSKTKDDRRVLQELVCRDDFHSEDIHGVNFDALEKELDQTRLPWQDPHGGWRKSKLTIGIPTGIKPTKADRRTAAAEARVAAQEAPDGNTAPAIDIAGIHFEIPDFWHRSIPNVMRSVIGHDDAAKDFVWEPYEEFFQPPGMPPPPPERVLNEMWTSDAFLKAHKELQESPPEPDCDLPRVIAGLILSSDGTHVAQFGQASLWPDYLAFANQSKYVRCRPQANATHHIAYVPKLPDSIREFLRKIPGRKGAIAPLLAHLRRELFHAAWGVLLEDDEFLEVYKHGMVLRCADGVTRRIYPRILVYSADYPEKVLIATIRDMGGCPCPRCRQPKDTLAGVGSPADREGRKATARVDDEERQHKVQEARAAIYEDGYVVNSETVENLLKPESLVPTENAFSAITNLGVHSDFDVHSILMVDLMHEFELGVWKAVFAHLVRILEAEDAALVDKLNERYRAMPTFGRSTIRRFTSDVSEMKKLAARDFEDMLQCAMPCFEGLLPSPHNEHVLDLLYVLAAWHATAKLRMHTDSSLKVLDSWTTSLGQHLRHFQRVTCAAYETYETRREREARQRAETRRQNENAAASSSQPSTSARRPKHFNLTRYKVHALGDYVAAILRAGPTDNFTTQTTELEHRRLKARYRRTNKNNATGQIVNIGIREAEMRRMGQELHELGVDVPGTKSKPTVHCAEDMPAEAHVDIAKEQHQANAMYLIPWLHEQRNDPAFTDFRPRIIEHMRMRIAELYLAGSDETDFPIYLEKDCIYRHATARFNYTTYDLRRDQDIINPSTDKRDILVSVQDSLDGSSSHPFAYARVLGIFHTQVQHPFSDATTRVDFLWVRWLQRDPQWPSGDHAKRLDCLRFVPVDSQDAEPFGFLDPMHVIRACHLMPGFSDGRTTTALPPSCIREDEGDWAVVYPNRFVDRDMYMRYLGLGVGHVSGTRAAHGPPEAYEFGDSYLELDPDSEASPFRDDADIWDEAGEVLIENMDEDEGELEDPLEEEMLEDLNEDYGDL